MKRFYLIFPIFLISTLCVLQVQAQTGGNTLTYIEYQALGNLNPYENVTLRNNNLRFQSLIYESLFKYDFNTEQYVNVLVDSFRDLRNNRFRVNLKRDVFWHDGQPFTSQDVVTTYQYIMNSGKIPVIAERLKSTISSIEINNDYSVTFHFNPDMNTDPRFILTQWILPHHLIHTSQGLRNFSRRPIGTGPFKFESLSLNGTLNMVVNENYHLSKPRISQIRTEIMPDFDTASLRLLSRLSDLLVDIPVSRISTIDRSADHRLEPYQSYTINVIAFNFKNNILNNQRVREAITIGFDRKTALEQWFDGRGRVLAGPFTPGAPYFNPEIQPRTHSRNHARQILRDLGYTDINGDGYLQKSNGERLQFRLLVNNSVREAGMGMQNVVQQFQDQMKEIGIQILLQYEITDIYDQRLMFDNDFDLALVGWSFDPTYDISYLFHSSFIRPGGGNIIGYRNNQIDDLFNLFRMVNNNVTRLNYMDSIQRILYNDIPYLFLFTIDRHAAINIRFINTVIDPLYFFSRIEEWDVIQGL